MALLPNRLNARIVVTVSCVLLATGIASGWIMASSQTASLLAAMRANSGVMAQDFSKSIARDLLIENYAELEVFLLKSVKLPDVRRLQVFDPDGTLIWDVERTNGRAAAHTGTGRLPVPQTRAVQMELDDERLLIWQPIEAGRPLGWLKAEWSLSSIRTAQESVWRTSLLLALAWVIGSAALIILILRPTVRSIGELTEFSKRLDRHKGEQIALVGQPTEIMDLAASLNEASTQLQATESQFRKLNLELEQRVAERTEQLESANKELEAFSYSVSHDLRAPLRHIDGFIHILREDMEAKLSADDRHYMDVIAKAAKQMETLIDDLLAFSRIGRGELHKVPVDLGALIGEVIQEAEPDLRGRNVEWRIGTLPVVTADRAMLRVAMSNLILNALKFTRNRNPALIEIGSEDARNETHISVRDNGAGFDMAYADKLFGVFQRLHRADDFEGTGIGLANVRRVVTRHGGRVWAEGKVGEGAAFRFSLPNAPG